MRLLLDAQKTPYSLEMKIGEDGGTELGEVLQDHAARSPEDTALEGDLSNEVERAMAPLSDREKEVLRLRYGLGRSGSIRSKRSGKRLSVTRERVRQIESRALEKLRSAKQREALAAIRGEKAREIVGPGPQGPGRRRQPRPTTARSTTARVRKGCAPW